MRFDYLPNGVSMSISDAVLAMCASGWKVNLRNYVSFATRVERRLLQWAIGNSRYGRPCRILRVWPVWERIARRLWPVVEVPNTTYAVLGLHFTHYEGEPFTFPDGTQISEGDLVGEIHIDNQALIRAMRESRGMDKFQSLTVFREELSFLARWSREPDFPSPIKGVYGLSLLSRGAVRLGFIIRPSKPGAQARLDRLFMNGLLVLYTPEGVRRLRRGRTASEHPGQAWMSMEELHRRYGS